MIVLYNYREVLSLSDCILLQEDLDTLSNWTKTWQLPLNIIKCKAMCLSNKRKVLPFTYHLNGTPLDWCLSHKYLGIMLNTKLLWNDQVAMVVAHSIKVLNLLRRTMFGCSKQVKSKAYLALVRPHMEYCAPVWMPFQKYLIDELESVQKRAARWICSKWNKVTFTWTKSYTECINELFWMPVSDRHKLLICCQVFKMIYSLDCLHFEKFFQFVNPNTRSHPLSIKCVQSRVNCYRYSFFVNAPFIWNDLPSTLHDCSCIASFKYQFKLFLSALT